MAAADHVMMMKILATKHLPHPPPLDLALDQALDLAAIENLLPHLLGAKEARAAVAEEAAVNQAGGDATKNNKQFIALS